MSQKPIPSPGQLAFMDWEFGVFFHFGIRSFFPGHKDWDNRPMPASEFNPDDLDCEKWIITAKAAGAAYAILVCKHHDGFANWPSKYTDYSVAHARWKNGCGDVVREFVDACRKHDMKIGLYYSPAQWGDAIKFSEAREYDDYFINQIGELLTGYGKIDYLWFDGCGSEGHEYDRERIITAIRSMQPDILVFNMWDPDTRWVGNENGHAPMPNPSTVDKLNFSILAKDKQSLENSLFLPAECDFKMRETWFDCEPNEDTVKDADELLGIYELSVGRGANFLINIGPDSHGRLPERDANRLLELGELIRSRYGRPIADFSPMKRESDHEWSIALSETGHPPINSRTANLPVNRLMIREDLTQGESVKEYRVYADVCTGGISRVMIYRGETIGHKALISFPTVRTCRLTVDVIASDGQAALRDITAFYSK